MTERLEAWLKPGSGPVIARLYHRIFALVCVVAWLSLASQILVLAGSDGLLRIQGCAECATLVHPPVPLCPSCRSRKWEALPVSGRGVVVGCTVNAHPWLPGFDPPYVVAVVALSFATWSIAREAEQTKIEKTRAERLLAESRIEEGLRLLEEGDADDVGDILAAGDETAVLARLRAFQDAGTTDLAVRPLPLGRDREARAASYRRTTEFVASLCPAL